jgi:hypothetical protein
MEAQTIPDLAVVQEGSRWRHGPPTPEELGDWFRQQPLHAEMEQDHDRYVGGLVVISSTDKVKRTRRANNGDTYIHEDEEVIYTPYVRVDTRIAYFRDYVAKHEEWIAKIRPVAARVIEDPQSAYFNAHLADRGFAIQATRAGDAVVFYAVCTVEVAIFERESWNARVRGEEPEPIMQGIGTKQVALTKSYGTNRQSIYADDNCLMKAETGAVGRALGFMGMLVIGTGVATAEDVQEAASEQSGAVANATPAAPQTPPVVNREGRPVEEAAVPPQTPQATVPETVDLEAQDTALRERALALQSEMQERYPDAWTTYMEWYRARGFGALQMLTGPALKGAVSKLERDLDAAKNADQETS